MNLINQINEIEQENLTNNTFSVLWFSWVKKGEYNREIRTNIKEFNSLSSAIEKWEKLDRDCYIIKMPKYQLKHHLYEIEKIAMLGNQVDRKNDLIVQEMRTIKDKEQQEQHYKDLMKTIRPYGEVETWEVVNVNCANCGDKTLLEIKEKSNHGRFRNIRKYIHQNDLYELYKNGLGKWS